MIDVFYIGQGDVRPAYPAEIRNHDGVIDLSVMGVTSVEFGMVRISTASVIVSAVASILDATLGRVEYTWSVADTQSIGEFAVSFKFIIGSAMLTLPRNNMAKVVVEDRWAIGE